MGEKQKVYSPGLCTLHSIYMDAQPEYLFFRHLWIFPPYVLKQISQLSCSYIFKTGLLI